MKYFHGSRKALAVGKKIAPRKSSFVNSDKPSISATEAVFEKSRIRVAPNSLSRYASVFMTETPDLLPLYRAGACLDHVYEVRPRTAVEKNHTGWWTLVNTHYDDPEFVDILQEWAELYWSGEECTLDHTSFKKSKYMSRCLPGAFEYRCSAFEVIACLGQASQSVGDARIFYCDRNFYFMIPKSTAVEDYFGEPFGNADNRENLVYADFQFGRSLSLMYKSLIEYNSLKSEKSQIHENAYSMDIL